MFTGKILNPIAAPPEKASLRARLLHAQQLAAAGYLPEPEKINRPLVIFMGGFRDGATLRFYNTALEYAQGPQPSEPPPAFCPERPFPWPPADLAGMGGVQDIYYRSHDTRAHILLLMTLYHAAGQRIALVGHSWGGASVYKAALKSPVPVDLLATLDPVSVFPLGVRDRPGQVRRWINVYLDFTRADMSDSSNRIAWIGRPWGTKARADISHDFIAAWPGVSLPGHAWCYEMFNLYVRPELERMR